MTRRHALVALLTATAVFDGASLAAVAFASPRLGIVLAVAAAIAAVLAAIVTRPRPMRRPRSPEIR